MDDQQFRQLISTIKRGAFLIAACIVLGFFSQAESMGWLAGFYAVLLLIQYFFS